LRNEMSNAAIKQSSSYFMKSICNSIFIIKV
jgi:hypothetical protein